jgi:hypothetical protein
VRVYICVCVGGSEGVEREVKVRAVTNRPDRLFS